MRRLFLLTFKTEGPISGTGRRADLKSAIMMIRFSAVFL